MERKKAVNKKLSNGSRGFLIVMKSMKRIKDTIRIPSVVKEDRKVKRKRKRDGLDRR